MLFHSETKDSVIKELESHPSLGLSSSRVSYKLTQYGENRLTEKRKKRTFKDFLISLRM